MDLCSKDFADAGEGVNPAGAGEETDLRNIGLPNVHNMGILPGSWETNGWCPRGTLVPMGTRLGWLPRGWAARQDSVTPVDVCW